MTNALYYGDNLAVLRESIKSCKIGALVTYHLRGKHMQQKTGVLWRDSTPEQLMVDQWGSPPFRIPVPGAAMREASSIADLGLWYAIGDAWAQLVVSMLPDGPATILDIGCSCGKVARYLTYDPNVNYLGLDVFKPAIDWCSRAFADAPRFLFQHLDVKSSLYNPNGAVLGSEVKLPVADGSIDIVIAASLFTHLLEPDFKRYLAEVARCLRPTGLAIVSVHFDSLVGLVGDEVRIDIAEPYFEKLICEAGMAVAKHGDMFGQMIRVLRPQA